MELLLDSDVYKGKHPERELQRAFTDAIQRIAKFFCNVYIILDGLDEVERREELLASLRKLSSCANLNLLIVSRLERDIESQFEGKPQLLIPEDMVRNDISSFVKYQFEHDKKLRNLKRSLKDELKRKLILQSGGM